MVAMMMADDIDIACDDGDGGGNIRPTVVQQR
jgi:hypothetical protein